MISRSDLAAVIAEKTMHVDVKNLDRAVAGYLLEQNRVDELDSIMRDVKTYRAAHGFVEATVISATPLTAESKKAVRAAIVQEFPDAKSYVLNERIDPMVIGGLRIELAGEELDLTVQAKLNKFKRLTLTRKD